MVCYPTFADIEIDGEGRTAIRLTVLDRERGPVKQAPLAVGDGVSGPTARSEPHSVSH